MPIFRKKKIKYIDSGINNKEEVFIEFPWKEEEAIYSLLENNDDLSRVIAEESFKQNSINDLEQFSFQKLIKAIVEDTVNNNDASLLEFYNCFGFAYFDKIKKGLYIEIESNKNAINMKNLLLRAKWLVRNGTRINLIKYAIFILGKYSDETEDIIFLGKNEYFAFNAVSILKGKENEQVALKEIYKESKSYIKERIINEIDLSSEEDKIWLIEEGVDKLLTSTSFAIECIKKSNIKDKLIQDEVSQKYIDGISILLYIILKKEGQCLYEIEEGGTILNHYVKHIMLRIIKNKAINSKYLCNLNYIKCYILNEENKKYLDENGLIQSDFPIVLNFIERAMSYLGWKKALVSELNERDHSTFDYIMEATLILKCDIWRQVFNLCVNLDTINSNLIKYLVLNDKNNNQDKILELILKKCDVVNIKFPKVENGIILSEECLAIEVFIKKYEKETKRYMDLIELTSTSALPLLVIYSAELLIKWDKPLRKYISIERIEGMIKDDRINNYNKKKLRAIKDNILLNL